MQTLDGSSSLPYDDLEDAITRAYELCADVLTLCEVTIILQAGDHYLLRTNRNFYRPSKFE